MTSYEYLNIKLHTQPDPSSLPALPMDNDGPQQMGGVPRRERFVLERRIMAVFFIGTTAK
jgi:hypothetical protein